MRSEIANLIHDFVTQLVSEKISFSSDRTSVHWTQIDWFTCSRHDLETSFQCHAKSRGCIFSRPEAASMAPTLNSRSISPSFWVGTKIMNWTILKRNRTILLFIVVICPLMYHFLLQRQGKFCIYAKSKANLRG